MKLTPENEQDYLEEHPKILIYGQSGAGKTTFSCSFPNVVLLDLENGLGMNRIKMRVTVDSYNEIESFFSYVKKHSDEFETIVIDSLNELIEVVIRDVVLGFDMKRPYGDQLTQSDYGKIAREVNAFTRLLFNTFPEKTIILTCAEASIQYEDQQRTFSITGKVLSETLPRLMDIVGCVFTAKEKHLITVANSSFAYAKNRYGLTSKPFEPTYDAFIEIMERDE